MDFQRDGRMAANSRGARYRFLNERAVRGGKGLRNDLAIAGIISQLDKWFNVEIPEDGNPAGSESPFFGASANGARIASIYAMERSSSVAFALRISSYS